MFCAHIDKPCKARARLEYSAKSRPTRRDICAHNDSPYVLHPCLAVRANHAPLARGHTHREARCGHFVVTPRPRRGHFAQTAPLRLETASTVQGERSPIQDFVVTPRWHLGRFAVTTVALLPALPYFVPHQCGGGILAASQLRQSRYSPLCLISCPTNLLHACPHAPVLDLCLSYIAVKT